MKPQTLCSKFRLLLSTSVVAMLGAFVAAPLPASAQEDAVTISAAEFQRTVYAADLLARFAEKPELDAALKVLLELDRRNPQADPLALADLSRQALQRYRLNAPDYVRAGGYRDEILATYLEALRLVPAQTNFVPATLQFLNDLLLSPEQITNRSPAELIHSGSQRFRFSSGSLEQRRRLLNACTSRARENHAFAAVLDAFLLPETSVSIHTPAANIIGNTNSALHDSATLQTLLSLSRGSEDGSVTVSSNQLLNLFNLEAASLWTVIHTNLAVRQEFNQSQPDLPAYLSNPLARAVWEDRQSSVQQSSVRQLASATAAILTQSRLVEAAPPLVELPGGVEELGDGLCAFADLVGGVFGKDPGQAISGAWNLFNLMTLQESAEDQMIREVGNLQILLGDLSTNMNYRFDRVDQSLTVIFQTLNEEFAKIQVAFDQQGRRIFEVQGGVDEVRRKLLTVESGLHRLERELFTGFNEVQRNDLVLAINGGLFYEAFNPAPMTYAQYSQIPNGPENTFYSYASDLAQNALSSPASFSAADLSAPALEQQLAARPLDANLNYVKQFLAATLGQTTDGVAPLANPRDWFAASDAYLQLALENPLHFRAKGLRVPTLINRGDNLLSFFRSLTFDGPNLNWRLQNAVRDFYGAKLGSFTNAVRGIEQSYANEHALALDTWRDWLAGAPRVALTATKVAVTPRAHFPGRPRAISASQTHFLVLRQDRTAVDFGVVPDYGRPSVPASLTNLLGVASSLEFSLVLLADGRVVTWHAMGPFGLQTNNITAVAVAAGVGHGLALLPDGRVTAWGNNSYGELNIPANLSNVLAIAAGYRHSLALKSDGRVVAWGNNSSGQAVTPAPATNVVAIAAGENHNLALRSDGTVIGWGGNDYGEASPPAGLSKVVAVAAGSHHSLALGADGTVTAWGAGTNQLGQWPNPLYGQSSVPPGLTNVVAIAAGGNYSLALQADGSLIAWGYTFQGHSPPPGLPTDVISLSAGVAHNVALLAGGNVVTWGNQPAAPVSASNVVAVAAGYNHSLALRADGTVVGWGYNFRGEADGAAAGGNIVAIAGGFLHSLGLRSDGRVVGWGDRGGGQGNLPPGATNIAAIAVGSEHNLALRADGQVFGWGLYSSYAVPTAATNVVAIAAGGSHFLALRADRTVVAWGNNDYGQAQTPAAATNVVAIAADAHHSLALRADGTAVAWGESYEGQTLIPVGTTNIIALAAGEKHSLFLTAAGPNGPAGSGGWVMDRAQIPAHVRQRLHELYGLVLTKLDLDLHDAAAELSGARAFWTAMLELSLPHTIEQDAILRGFLYGSEALPDLEVSRAFLEGEKAKIEGTLEPGPRSLSSAASLRQRLFRRHLEDRLNELAATGQPELPRLVQHTVRLLGLAREGWDAVAPPSLEASRQASGPSVVLYGEPYTRYTLQYRSELNGSVWTPSTIAGLRNEQSTALPMSGPQGYYRALLP